MNKKLLYNIGITIIAAIGISLLCTGVLFAAQAESISITVILNTDPKILDIQPPDGSTGYPEDTIILSINAEDKEGNNLQYQFSVDGEIRQPWSGSPTYNWVILPSDAGLHTIKTEVTDGIGEIQFQSAEVYIFLKPIGLPGD